MPSRTQQTKELLLSSHKNVPSFLPPKLGFVEGLNKSHFAPRWLGNHIKCHDFFPTTFTSKSKEKDWIRKRHLVFLHMFPNCLTLRSQEYPIGGISPILFWGWDWNPQSYSGDGIGFLGEVISTSCFSSKLYRGDFVFFSPKNIWARAKKMGCLGWTPLVIYLDIYFLSQWLTFKLLGITLGTIRFKLLFQGPLAEYIIMYMGIGSYSILFHPSWAFCLIPLERIVT